MAEDADLVVDKHVGSRVRMRRVILGISQGKLGDELGLTFQQAQVARISNFPQEFGDPACFPAISKRSSMFTS